MTPKDIDKWIACYITKLKDVDFSMLTPGEKHTIQFAVKTLRYMQKELITTCSKDLTNARIH